MASTFTSSLRFTKQGDGENPNTWGEILNGVSRGYLNLEWHTRAQQLNTG